MNDNDIVKALKLCRENEKHSTCEHCLKCPFSTCDLVADEENCLDALYRRSINLINRQKAEIERLEKELNTLTKQCYKSGIKEFADRLKESAFTCDVSFGFGREHCEEAVTVLEIDLLVKEMTEETP